MGGTPRDGPVPPFLPPLQRALLCRCPPFQLSFLSGIPGIVPMLHAVQLDILFGFLGGSRTRAVTGVMMMMMMMMVTMMMMRTLVMTATDSGKYAIAELT